MASRCMLYAALGAGLALPLSTTPVLAQPAPAASASNPGAEVETQSADLRRELKITRAELPDWNALATVMRQNAAGMEQLYQQRSQNATSMNAVENLSSWRDFARPHLADLNTLIPAFTKLFAALSPEQQKTADALFQNRATSRAGAR